MCPYNQQLFAAKSKGKGKTSLKGKGKSANAIGLGDNVNWPPIDAHGDVSVLHEHGDNSHAFGGGEIASVGLPWNVVVRKSRRKNDVRPGRWPRVNEAAHDIGSVDRNAP